MIKQKLGLRPDLRLGGGASAPAPTIETWHLYDEFTSGDLTSPRTATPGPGAETIVDSLTRLSLSSGELLRDANAAASNGVDPMLYSDQVANAIGLVSYSSVRIANTAQGNASHGIDTGLTSTLTNFLGHRLGFSAHEPRVAGSVIDPRLQYATASLAYTIPIDAELAVISRNPGAIWLQRYKAGQWRVIWVDNAAAPANVRMRLIDSGRSYRATVIGLGQIDRVFTDRYGIVTSRADTTADGQTVTAEADALIYHTITAQTGVTQELVVRRVDADNCWIVRMDQTNSTIKLFEKTTAGGEVERATAAQTWTNATQYRIGVIVDKYAIRAYVGVSYKCEYTSARSSNTATGVQVSHAGTNLTTWPLYVDLNVGTPIVAKSILPYGDSKTVGNGDLTSPYPAGQNGYPSYLCDLLETATGQTWREFPKRISRVGYGVNGISSMKALIDADLAVRHDAPDYVLINLGVNDLGSSIPNDPAAWQTDFAYILDTIHNKYPDARIGVQKFGRGAQSQSGIDTMNNAVDVLIPAIVSPRSFCFIGGDERAANHIEGGDDYATYTDDDIHPNNAGYQVTAARWKDAMGL